MHPDLMPFQVTGAKFLAARQNALICDEMGTGKTPAWIAACDEVGAKSVLVIVPGIARQNWVREFNRWQTKSRDVAAIMAANTIPDADVVIAPWHLLKDGRVLRYLFERQWDVVIPDEAHAAKNSAALQTRCLYGKECDGKGGIIKRARRVWPGSGTIQPNNASELWSHVNALFPDIAQGRSYRRWVSDYCIKRRNSEKIICNNERTVPQLAALLRPHIIRRLSKDVLPDLPPLRFTQVPVRPEKLPPMSRELRETEAVVAGAIAKSQGGTNPEAQAALAAVDEIHLASLRKWTGIAKAPAIGEYIAYELNNGLDSVLVFAFHQEVVETIASMLPDSAFIHGGVTNQAKRQRILDGFEGLVPGYMPRALVISVDIANAALNLVRTANVVFAETEWVPKTIEQAVKRAHRNGQTRPVTARMFSLAGSLDETIGAVLLRKLKQTVAFNKSITT